MTASLFISDLHLADERPESTETLLRFLRDTAPKAERLFILGDLFEYWIGDETLAAPMPAQVAGALDRLGKGGTAVFFMHGNRDFLIGPRFAKAAGVQLLPDPYTVTLYGTPTLLMHGDTLCTDDVGYQEFRKVVRNPEWQAEFLAKPVAERIELARTVRAESEQAKKVKSMTIMDVSLPAVETALREHAYPRLIHGHTHRPAVHEHVVDGHRCERIVLADWYGAGSCLECTRAGCRSVALT
ncbi:MAG: UDP-2,3-diacylglucosamine hydrolase [Betaproteobacteria bacterium SG8_40]|nr:MAG: UDP-2,3-diacylglucosamine hydrolase [Betaproteobacteria bacterium SG8_40]